LQFALDHSEIIPRGPGSPLGGWQAGKQTLFGRFVPPGSWRDTVMAAYSGPHDWLSSMWYTADGMFRNIPNWSSPIFWTHSVLNLVPATVFVGAQVAPNVAYSMRNGDY
jgi:hypothetical protein